MTAGRPTKYDQRFVFMAEEYLKKFRDKGEVIPTIAGLARYIGIRRSTIYEWAKHEDKKEFSDMMERINEEQEIITLSNGLTGEFKPQVSTLVLSKHGYSTKVDNVSSDGSMSPRKTLDDFYADNDANTESQS